MSEVTRLFEELTEGEPNRSEQLFPLVYHELRRLAAHRLSQEAPGQTLQPTALVHEAYFRLADVEGGQVWKSRGHFFAAAAQAMRRILVERARRRRTLKQGRDWQRVDVDINGVPEEHTSQRILALDQALERLAEVDPRKAELVELRFFCGLTMEQAALALNVSVATAHRDWSYARAWLMREIADDASDAG